MHTPDQPSSLPAILPPTQTPSRRANWNPVQQHQLAFPTADPSAAQTPATPSPPLSYYIRRYWLLSLILTLIGGGLGVAAAILSTPVYKVWIMLEMTDNRQPGLSGRDGGSNAFDLVAVQTQIQLLQNETFLASVAERMRTESIPPTPVIDSIFSRIRLRLPNSITDPSALMQEGLDTALRTFLARPVKDTRLIEISCDSTNPELAATFVNTLATEFIEQTTQQKTQQAQKSLQWISGQIEEAEVRYQEAEKKLQEFIKKNNSVFSTATVETLNDSKLKQLQGELAAIQSDRISKQTKYEMALRSAPGTLPDVLDDSTLRNYQAKIAELRQEKAGLLTTFTAAHYKVKRVQAQIDDLEKTLRAETQAVVQRIHNDFETAKNRESLLARNYSIQAGTVLGQADDASVYSMLRRAADVAKQDHDNLLQQANTITVANSLPESGIRIVNRAKPPRRPYKPQPLLYIGFGLVAGLFLSGGLLFIRESLDRTVKAPGTVTIALKTRELGVIPSIANPIPEEQSQVRQLFRKLKFRNTPPNTRTDNTWRSHTRSSELSIWKDPSSLAVESFRAALASLWNAPTSTSNPQVILIGSPSSKDGKTLFVSNMAIAMAETGSRVLVIDTDFRRPRLHDIFQVDGKRGILSLLAETTPIETYTTADFGIPTAIPRVTVLPAGSMPSNLQELLYAPRLATLFRALRRQYDVVIIDSSPLLLYAESRIIAQHSDGVVMVLRSESTSLTDASQVEKLLTEDGVPLLGVVLNDWRPTRQSSDYYQDVKTDTSHLDVC